MTKPVASEEFVVLAVQRLRTGSFKGIHSVFSGFNEAFKIYYKEGNPIDATEQLAAAGKIVLRPTKRGVMIYLPGEAPDSNRGEAALKKMGLT